MEVWFRGFSTLTTTARSMTKTTTTAMAMVLMKRFFEAIRVYGNSFYGTRLGSFTLFCGGLVLWSRILRIDGLWIFNDNDNGNVNDNGTGNTTA